MTRLIPLLILIHPASVLAQEHPALTRPLLFHIPEADAIVAKLQIFPPDNPWHADVSRWPVAANSADLVASIGANLKLRSNHDMGYVLVPPHQPKVPVKITGYPNESDPGPFPVPEEMPIEGWPSEYRTRRQGRFLSLREVQADILQEGGDRHALVVDPFGGQAPRILLHEADPHRLGGGPGLHL